MFEVDLVADTGARRHGGKVLEALGAPFEEVVTLGVARIFQLDVLFERFGMTEFVDHDRVVDDEVDRNLWVDLGGVAAQLGDRIAHRGQIDHAGDAGKVLQQHPRRAILDFLAGLRILLPIGDCADMLFTHGETAILEAQHVLQQRLHREGQLADIADFLGRFGQRVIGVVLAAYGHGAAGAESVLADLCHRLLLPFELVSLPFRAHTGAGQCPAVLWGNPDICGGTCYVARVWSRESGA